MRIRRYGSLSSIMIFADPSSKRMATSGRRLESVSGRHISGADISEPTLFMTASETYHANLSCAISNLSKVFRGERERDAVLHRQRALFRIEN